jgi:hypothetical protein
MSDAKDTDSQSPARPLHAAKPKHARALPVVAIVVGGALLGLLVIVAVRLSRPTMSGGLGKAAGVPLASTKAPAKLPEVESRIFQVTEATGRVEAHRGGAWVLIVPGDVLTQDDVVRTGVGRAILKLGRTTEIELRDRVEIRLDSISGRGASVDLRRGRVVAHVSSQGSNVAITSARTRTENEGGAPARFVVTADEHGRVAVAATEGVALFESAGRSVKVTAGTTTRADPGRPPIDPEKISEDVFLSVTWPAGERREERVPVTGRATPGSVVRVNGADADVDSAGRFVASVPVRVGANALNVEVEDVSGRSRSEQKEVHRISTRPPNLAPVPTELWNQ